MEELRKIKDKKISKKYLDWQLLKRGVIPEKKREKNVDVAFPPYEETLDEFIGKDPEFREETILDESSRGRENNKSFGPGEFVKKYLGKGNC